MSSIFAAGLIVLGITAVLGICISHKQARRRKRLNYTIKEMD